MGVRLTDAWTEREMKQALFAHYQERYAVISEVCAYDPADRRIDILLYHRKERRAIEIKVSKSDLDVDLRRPEKQAPWRELTHKHYYAVPETLARDALASVPLSSGVIVVSRQSGGWGVQVKRNVRRVNEMPAPLPDKTIQALAYRLAPLEANAKGLSWVSGNAAGTDVETAARIQRLERDLEIANGKLARRGAEVDTWRQRLAAAGPLWCRHCGQRVLPELRVKASGRRGASAAPAWRHAEASSEPLCEPIRARAAAAAIDGDTRVEAGLILPR